MINFNFKDVETVDSEDFWYDLFYGGYIKPEYFLEGEQLEQVKNAVDILYQFNEQLKRAGLIEQM